MPIDINLLRKDKGGDPDKVRESEKRRFRKTDLVDEVIDLDQQWIKAQYDTEQVKKEQNALQKQITERKKASKGQDKCEELVAQKDALTEKITGLKELSDDLLQKRDHKLHYIGNIVHDSVPISNDEEKDNKIVKDWCPAKGKLEIPAAEFKTNGKRPHYQIMEMLGFFDTDKGVEAAGHRGYYLTGPGVILNQALISYGLAFLYKKGYTPVQPPFFMKKDMMGKVAELKDYEESLYKIVDDPEKPETDMFLIATSEQPLCVLHHNKMYEKSQLPGRYAGFSSCFRKEAGSSGRDIRGIFRVHQFEKIEQFIVTTPEESVAEHDRMITTAQEFYESLEIPYQTVCIVSAELNDAASKKYDLEAWFPGDNDGKGQYRELVSCSNCNDYQSRAMNTKHGFAKSGEKQEFCHMLNSTLCATERALCCLVENYQDETGVRVPEALRPYCMGIEHFPFVKTEPTPEKDDKKAKKDKKSTGYPDKNGK